MIVCHSKKFIFVHLHKTAGTSIKEAIVPFLDPEDLFIGVAADGPVELGPPSLLKQLQKHSSAAEIANTIGLKKWNAYFKFTLVRHPFDRLVSLYEFFHRVKRNNLKRPGLLKSLFFQQKDLLESIDPNQKPWNWPGMQALLSTDSFSEFIRSEHLAHERGAAPQTDSLTNDHGELMVDFVGQLETLAEDWQRICERTQVQVPLAHENQSHRRHQSLGDYWSEEDIEFASEKYRSDFELLGYEPTL